jgi:hypothetical protein
MNTKNTKVIKSEMKARVHAHVEVAGGDFVERDDDGEVGNEEQAGHNGHSDVAQRAAFHHGQERVLVLGC